MKPLLNMALYLRIWSKSVTRLLCLGVETYRCGEWQGDRPWGLQGPVIAQEAGLVVLPQTRIKEVPHNACFGVNHTALKKDSSTSRLR